jgi:hypothetical protein
MKKVIAIVLASLVAGSATQLVAAADLTSQQQTKIAERCSDAQLTLQRISSSDTTTRINRGRDYDQILKLFYAMNTRVASNNITEPRLTELTKALEDTLNGFRSNYNRYNDILKSTYEVDCKNQVGVFYDNLVKTRENRALINADVAKLDNLINEYQLVAGGLTGER